SSKADWSRAIAMFLSVVILGRFTTETHAMALYISTDTPPLFTPRPGTFPNARTTCENARAITA
ncbi:hypothetical protein KY296_19230, partial [Mycobacterium avium subsp. paratuberculosis]|nr:hypothetical protein [Mycobacterium avium subsp. paratuberculosis]